MGLVKTTRLIKQDGAFEIEIPDDFVSELNWREGLVLEIKMQEQQLVIEKLHGFVGS